MHQRPSDDHARTLITSLLRPEFNRAETAINAESGNQIHQGLLKVCERSYRNIIHSSDILASFQEHFASLPRAVLDCCARDQLVPESEALFLKNRLQAIELKLQNVCSSLEQRDQDCELIRHQIRDLQGSRSWKITAPFRAFADHFRSWSR